MKNVANSNLALVTTTVAIGGFLFGFDMAVISGILPFVKNQFALSSSAEGWFVASALVGCIIGVLIAADIGDRIGRKKALLVAAFCFVLASLGCTFLAPFSYLIAARILGGIAIGIASSIVPLYLSEIAPPQIRGRLVTYYQLAITIGILVAYISNSFVSKYQFLKNSWLTEEWRQMFAVSILPATIFLFGLFFIPESPRWHKNSTKNSGGASEKNNYTQLLNPAFRRPLMIAILLPLFSQFCGINAIIYYGPTILHSAGISLDNSLMQQIIFGAANMIFTFLAIWKVDSLGRRPLYLYGTAGAAIALALTGYCFFTENLNGALLLISVLLFLACFAFSIGPLKFVVASEIFPDSVRAKALSLSIMVMWVADTIVGQLTPVMLEKFGTGPTFWIFAFFCVVAFITVYKILPETKGRSLDQIAAQWQQTGRNE